MICLKTKTPENTENCNNIELSHDLTCLVDKLDYENLSPFHWHVKKSSHCLYVYRKILKNHKWIYEKIHRVIANTQKNQECHHINGNSLDNRRANLLNVSKIEHISIHSVKTHHKE